MLRSFLVIVIFSTLIVSNINLYEAKLFNYQIGQMKTCSIKCAPPFCRIKCIPNLTTTITPTTATSTIMTSTAITLTTMTSTTNTKADDTENQEVCNSFILLKWNCFFTTATIFISTTGRIKIYLFMDVIFPFIWWT